MDEGRMLVSQQSSSDHQDTGIEVIRMGVVTPSGTCCSICLGICMLPATATEAVLACQPCTCGLMLRHIQFTPYISRHNICGALMV